MMKLCNRIKGKCKNTDSTFLFFILVSEEWTLQEKFSSLLPKAP